MGQIVYSMPYELSLLLLKSYKEPIEIQRLEVAMQISSLIIRSEVWACHKISIVEIYAPGHSPSTSCTMVHSRPDLLFLGFSLFVVEGEDL